MAYRKAPVFKSRAVSVADQCSDVKYLARINNFPVFIGVTSEPQDDDIFADLIWDICQKTGCIQLRNLLDPSLIYSAYHSEALGGVWRQHQLEFSKFVKKYLGKKVLEIGGSNGSLAHALLSQNSQIESYEIIEPNPKCEQHKRLSLTNAFFSNELAALSNNIYDTILHSHTLEHAYDPVDFIHGTATSARVGTFQVFSVPNLEIYLERKFSNILNFEHTYLLTRDLIIYLMWQSGFELLECKDFQSHSVFYAFLKTENPRPVPIPDNYERLQEEFLSYTNFFEREVVQLNKKISNFNGEIFLFGGHVFSQFLLALGLNERKIVGVLDNSQVKRGKRLYGTALNIFSPEKIKDKDQVAVILKVGQYQDEVREQLLAINREVIIWE